MTNLAQYIGRVMMTAVSLPRSDTLKYKAMRDFAKTEYRSSDYEYVLDCLMNDRPINVV
jgi:hypothetical protein